MPIVIFHWKSRHQKLQKVENHRPKPIVAHKWGNDEIHKFISNVEDHECIWNFSLKEHKKLNQRESAWQIIDDEMGGLGIAELKAK